jgi:hypothetical protein
LLGPVFPTVDDVACDSGPSYLVNTVDLIMFALMGLAVLMLARVARAQLTRLGRNLAMVGATASIATGVVNAIEHCAHLEALGLVYAMGLAAGVFATAGFGLSLARSGALPQWIGWVVTAGALAFSLAAEQGWGRPLNAVAWAAVGVALIVGARRAAHQAAPR